MMFGKRVLGSAARIFMGVPIVSSFAIGVLLCALSATWRGRTVGLGVTVLAGLAYCTIGYYSREWFKRRRRLEMLFLHGARDRRIPRRLVEQTVSTLKFYKCRVRLDIYEDEDHYLILAQPKRVVDQIAALIGSVQLTPMTRRKRGEKAGKHIIAMGE